MKLSAYVREKGTKNYTVIERDYPTKTAFYYDLRGNGYAVVRISNNRDLAAQDTGDYKSFSEMKEMAKKLWSKNPELWASELAMVENISKISL